MVGRTIIKTARGTLSDLQQRNQDEELIPFELVYLTDQERLAICTGEGNPTPTLPSDPHFREIPTLNNPPGNFNVWEGGNVVQPWTSSGGGGGAFGFLNGTLVLANGATLNDAQGVQIILSEATATHLVAFPDKSGTVAFLDDIPSIPSIPSIPEGTQKVALGSTLLLNHATFSLISTSKPPVQFMAYLDGPTLPVQPHQITIFRPPDSPTGTYWVETAPGVEIWMMDGLAPGTKTTITFNQPRSFITLTPIQPGVWGVTATVGVGLS